MAVAALAIGFAGMSACSHDGQSPAPRSAGNTLPATACESISPKRDDLAGLLNAPITQATPVPGDIQSCAYLTEGFPSITISVRPGVGKSTLDAWEHGKMPFEATPIAGVGEAALWQPALRELIARQGDLLCDVQVRAGANDVALGPEALSAAAGALCNKIFAVPRR
jgi:hypothetical protein